MSSGHRRVSSGSDGGDPLLLEEKKRKRMQSNRESAKRSRMRKQKQVEDLTEEAGRLKSENEGLKQKIKAAVDARTEMEAANNVIRAQTKELEDRLQFLNSVVEKAENVNGRSNDMSMFSDPLLKPWFIPHSNYSLIASSDMSMH
ncbi:bZIP transcription factor 53-like [Vicia villosa]|uniref:bZIP transcription factor 53-like n=1 Tax=Vicia villosa TaxID=3911 RepID=UPI00273A9F25|nr:bZIP transcription factor 53-like [Vicia villosa]